MPTHAESADTVRQRVRGDVATWQRVPALALGAADPADNVLWLTIAEGYFPVGDVANMFSAYVDCATGEIVDAEDPTQPATDDIVLMLDRDFPREINAAEVAHALLEKAVENTVADKNASWRNDLRRSTGLRSSVPYTRSAHDGRSLD